MTLARLFPKRVSFYLIILFLCSSLFTAYDNFKLRATAAAATYQATKLAKDMSTLKRDNKRLAKSNKALQTRYASIKKQVKQRNKKRAQTLLSRMGKKMATAPLRMLPLVGTGAVVTATAADIHSSCSDMASMAEFETKLFGGGVIPVATNAVPPTLCGVDVEKELQKSALTIESKVKEAFDISETKYDEMSKQIGGFTHDVIDRNSKAYDEFKHDMGGFINDVITRMNTKEPKQTKPAPLPVLYDDTTFDYINYFMNEHKFFNW